jgi:hypothetical protein
VVAVFRVPPLVLSLQDAPRIAEGGAAGRAAAACSRPGCAPRWAACGPVRVEPRSGFAIDRRWRRRPRSPAA